MEGEPLPVGGGWGEFRMSKRAACTRFPPAAQWHRHGSCRGSDFSTEHVDKGISPPRCLQTDSGEMGLWEPDSAWAPMTPAAGRLHISTLVWLLSGGLTWAPVPPPGQGRKAGPHGRIRPAVHPERPGRNNQQATQPLLQKNAGFHGHLGSASYRSAGWRPGRPSTRTVGLYARVSGRLCVHVRAPAP